MVYDFDNDDDDDDDDDNDDDDDDDDGDNDNNDDDDYHDHDYACILGQDAYDHEADGWKEHEWEGFLGAHKLPVWRCWEGRVGTANEEWNDNAGTRNIFIITFRRKLRKYKKFI